jgi:hypothetical protein
MDTTRYVSVTFKKGLLIEGGLHPQCSQGEVLSQDEYVKYSDVEKAVKLWEMMIRPKRGLFCIMCDYKKFYEGDYCCTLFDKPIHNGRCNECLDIFGGE